MESTNERYLELLAQSYPTQEAAAAEIIRLKSQLALPKGAEYFVSDVHGEYRAFSHILRNGSGAVRRVVIAALDGDISDDEASTLATLIAYPTPKFDHMVKQVPDPAAWSAATLKKLVTIAQYADETRSLSNVRDDLLSGPTRDAMSELLADSGACDTQKEAYREAIIDTIVETGMARTYIIEFCHLIQNLVVAHLHVVGDIYDRGPAPDKIVDLLMKYPSVDIQWGNHDIVWMGAALGQRGCIAHVVRNCARYGNLDILADAYGINILPLATFALEAYRDDPCVAFGLKVDPGLSPFEKQMNIKIQKAMAILQFKVEAKLIDEYPSFGLQDRKQLHRIDWDNNTITIGGVTYELTDTVFPTVDRRDPYALTPEEEAVMQHLEHAFVGSEKLQRHIRYLLEAGSLYRICNGNLLLHACVPLNDDGSLKEVDIFGKTYSGRALFDVMEQHVRNAFTSLYSEERKRGRDLMWYLWLGEGSPLFAKNKMATFEIYLIADKAARKEEKNAFYKLFDDVHAYDAVFEDFGLDSEMAHIICGHVPVKAKDGEDPVKAKGRIIYIDGGMSAAYQKTTGIAGYTLVSDARELTLYAQGSYPGERAVVEQDASIASTARVLETYEPPQLLADTDRGAAVSKQLADLYDLLGAYAS